MAGKKQCERVFIVSEAIKDRESVKEGLAKLSESMINELGNAEASARLGIPEDGESENDIYLAINNPLATLHLDGEIKRLSISPTHPHRFSFGSEDDTQKYVVLGCNSVRTSRGTLLSRDPNYQDLDAA